MLVMVDHKIAVLFFLNLSLFCKANLFATESVDKYFKLSSSTRFDELSLSAEPDNIFQFKFEKK